MIILTLLGIAAVGGAYYYYRKYRANLTADALVATFTSLVAKLEAYAETKVTEIENYITQAVHLDQLKTEAEAEAQKAKDYAAKIKGLFS